MKFDAIVFDFDGTLGDSGISRDVLVSWCEQLSLDCEYFEIIEYLHTLPSEIQAEKTRGLLRLEEQQMAQTELYPGAVEWFSYLRNHNIKCAIYSRNTKKNIEAVLNAKQLSVDMIMGRDCSIPKPHPQGLEIIVEKMNLDKDRTLMVGDSLISDVQVGKLVGVKTALVNFEGGHNDEKIKPDYVWKNLEEGYKELCI
jgi:HAD superfamily hydrolase (TIGR01549 family)